MMDGPIFVSYNITFLIQKVHILIDLCAWGGKTMLTSCLQVPSACSVLPAQTHGANGAALACEPAHLLGA